jgi:hypothetical protein
MAQAPPLTPTTRRARRPGRGERGGPGTRPWCPVSQPQVRIWQEHPPPRVKDSARHRALMVSSLVSFACVRLRSRVFRSTRLCTSRTLTVFGELLSRLLKSEGQRLNTSPVPRWYAAKSQAAAWKITAAATPTLPGRARAGRRPDHIKLSPHPGGEGRMRVVGQTCSLKCSESLGGRGFVLSTIDQLIEQLWDRTQADLDVLIGPYLQVR